MSSRNDDKKFSTCGRFSRQQSYRLPLITLLLAAFAKKNVEDTRIASRLKNSARKFANAELCTQKTKSDSNTTENTCWINTVKARESRGITRESSSRLEGQLVLKWTSKALFCFQCVKLWSCEVLWSVLLDLPYYVDFHLGCQLLAYQRIQRSFTFRWKLSISAQHDSTPTFLSHLKTPAFMFGDLYCKIDSIHTERCEPRTQETIYNRK